MIAHLSPIQKGIAIGFLGYTSFSVADVFGKWIVEHGYPPVQILCIETFVAACILIFFSKSLGGFSGILHRSDFKYHAARILLNVALNLLIVFSFSIMSLANIYSMVFAKPFFAVLLAILFYNEYVGVKRWISIIIGFLGILIVLQPTPDTIRPELFLPLFAAFLVAVFFILGRSITQASPFVAAFYPMIGSAVLTLPATILLFQPIPFFHLLFFIGGGCFVALGVLCVSQAFRTAPASLVSPFLYSQMIWGLLFGYFIFNDTPDLWMLAGSAVIVSSGLYLLQAERKKPAPEKRA